MKTEIVRVLAPARLHLGFLDMSGSLGRKFGGIGLGLAAPETVVRLRRIQGETRVAGPEATRAARYLASITAALHLEGSYELTVDTAIPAHAGLGSGTQLALAVAAAVRHLNHIPLDPEGDAARLGRGMRSGLGAGLFRRGGLMVDGGKGSGNLPPPIIADMPFPAEWRIILVLDRQSKGIHGPAEIEAFKALPPFPESDAAEICRLTLMQLLPALAERDLTIFGKAVYKIQRRVGAHFSPAQGGIFSSSRVAAIMDMLDRLGAHGSGQSSWGPTGFAFAPNLAAARRLVQQIAESGLAEGLDIRIVEARTGGATVETVQHLTTA